MIRSCLFVGCFILISIACSAQFQGNVYVEDSTIKVWAGGHQNQLAWCGGFNNPQISIGDLNNDGKPDLTVYETTSGLIKTFINTGVAGAPIYNYQPKYALNFPRVKNFVKLADYNRDGIPDLITSLNDGFTIYKGKWNAQNQLTFTYYKDLQMNAPGLGLIYAFSYYIPAVVDADGDGDLDFFSFDSAGAIISFFKNCQMEHGLPNDSIEICWPTQCWGEIAQSTARAFYLGFPTGPGTICNFTNNFGCKGTLHGGNNVCILDYDGDGDMDLLNGNTFYSEMQLAINGKAQYNPTYDSIVSQDTIFQTGGHQIHMPTFPAAFNVDADGDGKKDILISPPASSASENYKCIALYKNTGTATSPIFTYQTDTFLIDHSIDAGTASYPFLYDYNKDGRLDLIVGSEGYYQAGGTFRSKLKYYQNTLVGGETRLVLQTDDLAGTFADNFSGSAPAVGDLDGDGIDDLVLGHTDGTLSFYKNMSANNSMPPQWQLSQRMMKKSNGDTIHVGYNATPFIYDINKDGKPDLLIGYLNGGVYYYQNITTVGSNTLALVQGANMLGGMNAHYMMPGFGGQSVPFVGKMDNSGKDYFLLGNDKGVVLRYDGFQSGNTNLMYNLIDTAYSHIHVGARSSFAVGDIDKDGHYDMIIGNDLGGLQLFKQVLTVNVNSAGNPFGSSPHCSLYPSPATDAIYFTWDEVFSSEGPVVVRIMNMAGAVVAERTLDSKVRSGSIDVKPFASGNYIGYISGGNQRFASRFAISK